MAGTDIVLVGFQAPGTPGVVLGNVQTTFAVHPPLWETRSRIEPWGSETPSTKRYASSRHLCQFGHTARVHPFGDVDVAFQIEAGVVRMHKPAIVPQLLIFADSFLALRLDPVHIRAQLGDDLVGFIQQGNSSVKFGNQ